MGVNPSCTCPEKHSGHMCELLEHNEVTALDHIMRNPTVHCADCGAKANSAEYVCVPEPLNE